MVLAAGVGGGRSIITSLLAGTTPSNRLTDCGRFLSNKLRSIQAYGVCAFQILLRMGSGKRPRDEVPGLESWSLKSLVSFCLVSFNCYLGLFFPRLSKVLLIMLGSSLY